MTKHVVPRSEKGHFLPGYSGSPGGRGRDHYAVSDLAKSHAPKAVATLAALMVDKKVPAQVRVNAAQALLDRGYGRPMQSVEAKVETVDMGAAHLAALKELADKGLMSARARQDATTIEGVAVRVED